MCQTRSLKFIRMYTFHLGHLHTFFDHGVVHKCHGFGNSFGAGGAVGGASRAKEAGGTGLIPCSAVVASKQLGL